MDTYIQIHGGREIQEFIYWSLYRIHTRIHVFILLYILTFFIPFFIIYIYFFWKRRIKKIYIKGWVEGWQSGRHGRAKISIYIQKEIQKYNDYIYQDLQFRVITALPAMPPAILMPGMKDDYIQSFKLILPCLPCLLPPKRIK